MSIFADVIPDPDGGTFKPGDEVIFEPEKNLDPDSLKLFISRISRSVAPASMFWKWELSVGAIRRVTQRPQPDHPGTPPPIPEIEVRHYPGFIVPQLLRGNYQLHYQSGEERGRTITITIVPRLAVQGLHQAEINCSATLTVQIVGPLQRPRLVRHPAHPQPLPGRLEDLVRRQERGDHTVSTEVWVDDISDESIITLPTDEAEGKMTRADGKATFEFETRALGTARVRFTSRDFPSVEAELQVVRHPVPAVYEDASRTYNVLITGTSLTWGQGLREHHKFSRLVMNWTKNHNYGRRASGLVYAHSGALTVPALGEAARDANPENVFPGEIPAAHPSISFQLERAASDGDLPDPIDLVMLDAGINDVGLPTILTPNPFD